MNVGILGIGRYVPEKVVTNHDLEKIIEDAKEYRWYSVPDMYMVESLDT